MPRKEEAFNPIEPLQPPTKVLQSLSKAFESLDRSLLRSPGDGCIMSPPPVLGAAAHPGSPVLPERDRKAVPPTSVLQLSPHVASPSLISGLEAAEQRLEKYLVAKRDPPDPQTASIQKTKKGLREALAESERKLWARRTLLDQCEILERRKLVEEALSVEMDRVVTHTKREATEHRNKLSEHIAYLQHLLEQQEASLAGQVDEAEAERIEACEEAAIGCRDRCSVLDRLMTMVQAAAATEDDVSDLVVEVTAALNADELMVGSHEPGLFELTLDTVPVREQIRAMHFRERPSAAAAAACLAKLWDKNSDGDDMYSPGTTRSARVRALFRKFDDDGSGILGIGQFSQMLSELNPHLTEQQAAELYASCISGEGHGISPAALEALLFPLVPTDPHDPLSPQLRSPSPPSPESVAFVKGATEAVTDFLNPPPVPTSLCVQHIPAVSQEPQFFRVKWPPVNGALSYLLERITADGEHLAEYFGPDTHADLDMAVPGDKVRLRADNTIASSKWSGEVECTAGSTSTLGLAAIDMGETLKENDLEMTAQLEQP